MDRTLISWNIPNMFTISLMALAGYVALTVIVSIFKGAGVNTTSGGGF